MMTPIEKSRSAFAVWRRTPLSVRLKLMSALRVQIVQQTDRLLKIVGEQTQKPPTETLINEIVPALEAIKYYEKNAAAILKTEKRPGTFLFPKSRFQVEYHPRGVVLILSPFNFPFQLALIPSVTALLAGNTVVCKVSEHTSGLASLLFDLFAQAGFPRDIFQTVTGGLEVGEALVKEKPDMIFLTGGVETGKKVMSLAAQNLTPVILELGGKDPMIVFADAPFERTVKAAIYGSFANAGQVCVATERVYVQRPLLEPFIKAVLKEIPALRLGSDEESDIGPLLSDSHTERFKMLIHNAVTKGATLHTELNIQGRLVAPVVLSGVTSEMKIMQEETFGPAMPITAFDTEEEAVAMANDSDFGLNASVWTSDLTKARRVASQIEAGNVAINDVLKNIGNPHMPFGGIKSSGVGLYHGPEGLRAFCRPLSVTINSGRMIREPNWFPYDKKKSRDIRMMIGLLYSSQGWLDRFRYLKSLRKGFKS